jgi:SAM-dependent methyltransferase
MTEDPYAGFAERYDRFHGEFGQHDEAVVGFFRQLFRENEVHSVLDCACGTGQHLPLFHTLGCDVAGSDLSAAMLARAGENLAGLGLSLPLYQADYRHLPRHFDRRFDAVVCLSSSLLHMPDEEQARRALSSMRAILRPGGILVLTQGTSDRQWREKPRFLLAVNERDFSRLFVIDYVGEGATYHILDVEHGEEARGLRVWSVDYPCMLLRADHEQLLQAAGFARLAFYGTYTFEPYDVETSRRLISVAWK